jgi:hypothetical protein
MEENDNDIDWVILLTTMPYLFDLIHEHSLQIYREGDVYCFITAISETDKIFGCGDTPEKALRDWEKSYEQAKKDGRL